MLLFKNAAAVNEAVKKSREEAREEAVKNVGRKGVLRSRGVELVAVNAKGDKVSEGGSWYWDGKASSLPIKIGRMSELMPEASSIYAEGGFDWAESPRAMNDFDYDPLVSEWSVEIWKKESA